MDYKWIARALYPPACLLCGEAGARDVDLCSACFGDLPWNRHPCPRCAAPLPPDEDDVQGRTSAAEGRGTPPGAPAAATPRLCGSCIKVLPSWDAARSPLVYAYPVDKLVQRFKFEGDLAVGRLLGSLLADYLAAGGDRPDCIVPVPLHASRLKERGFNQAVELAAPISKRLRIRVRLDLCERSRATQVQSRLDAAERKKNLRDAFAVKTSVQGLHVALLDDVVTTGATAETLARTFKEAGAARISLWSVCRAVSALT